MARNSTSFIGKRGAFAPLSSVRGLLLLSLL
ncbi:hypothetical protein U713_02475 [Rhodobacter capsulatus YW2]|nr:hypothetical protein U713_02475 [Rhodobacter capsulatus YW2]